MVGLDGPGGDQGVGTLGQGIGRQVFELAQLVAAHGQGRGVVALDVDVAAGPGRQALELFQGGGVAEQVEAVETGELLFDHESARNREGASTIGSDIWPGNR